MDVPPEYIHREEFDGYVRRHEADPYCHTPMVTRLSGEGLAVRERFENRIGSLELWQARIVGAVAMLTFLVTCGVIAAVIELLRK